MREGQELRLERKQGRTVSWHLEFLPVAKRECLSATFDQWLVGIGICHLESISRQRKDLFSEFESHLMGTDEGVVDAQRRLDGSELGHSFVVIIFSLEDVSVSMEIE